MVSNSLDCNIKAMFGLRESERKEKKREWKIYFQSFGLEEELNEKKWKESEKIRHKIYLSFLFLT